MSNNKNIEIVALTDSANEQLKYLITKESNNPDGIRLNLLAGGCSGLSYNLEFDKIKDNDFISDYNGIKIIIDQKSALYLNGVTLDYQGGLTGRGFVFTNPNATKTCGCGTSFAVGGKEVTLEFINNKKPTNVCPSSNPSS